MAQARRGFLKHSGAAMAGLALLRVPGAAGAIVAPAASGALDGHSLAALTGRRFQVDTGAGTPVAVRLVEVDTRDAGGRSFSLIFRSDDAGALSEGIHGFSAEGCDRFAAFVAPIEGDGRTWQVVFNRG
jgi:hypothetical protein